MHKKPFTFGMMPLKYTLMRRKITYGLSYISYHMKLVNMYQDRKTLNLTQKNSVNDVTRHYFFFPPLYLFFIFHPSSFYFSEDATILVSILIMVGSIEDI